MTKEEIKKAIGEHVGPICMDTAKLGILVTPSIVQGIKGEVLLKQEPTSYFELQGVEKILDIVFNETYRLVKLEFEKQLKELEKTKS